MSRIAIIGAGAIGCTLSALLARAGHDITLVARPNQIAAIRANGLRLDGALGTFTVHVSAVDTLDARPDLVLLAVKTQDVLGAVQTHRAYLADVPIVTLQNGIRSDDFVASVVPSQQIVSAVVLLVANYLTSGMATVVMPGALLLGSPFPQAVSQVPMVTQLLNTVIPTYSTANIRGAHWLKLLVNLNNALPALTNIAVQELYSDPFFSRVSVNLIREGMAVITQAGIQLEPIPDVSVASVKLLSRLPVRIAARLFARRVRQTVTDVPLLGSTLQSLRRARPTEIAYLNGEVVRLGREIGVPTPLNALIVALINHVEQRGTFLSTVAVREMIKRNLRTS